MDTLLLPGRKHLITKNIIYLESDSNYTIIHNSSSPHRIITAKSLCHVQQLLCPDHFVRINRQQVINLKYVKRVWEENDVVKIRLHNGSEFKTSRRRTHHFLKLIESKQKVPALRSKLLINKSLKIASLLLLVTQLALATTRYVKPTSTGLGDGSSWANATSDLQAMINASTAGDEVWVAAGVYYPLADGSGNTTPANPKDKLFFMKSGVKLYGGFSGTETSLSQRDFITNRTILSGDIDQNDTNTDGNFINESYADIQGNNSYHVMVFPGTNESTEFDGFIVTGGKTTGTTGYTNQTVNGYSISSFRGGALYFSGAAPQIRNCIISGNEGDTGVLYQNNQNSASGWTTQIENTYWVGNNVPSGGIVYFHRGGVQVKNSVFVNNNSYYSGLYVSSNMPNGNVISFDHITYAKNSIGQYGNHLQFQGGTVAIKNSVFWENVMQANPLVGNAAFSLTFSYSDIEGSGAGSSWNSGFGTDGGNNIDLNPQFSDSGNPYGADRKLMTADDGLKPTTCSPLVNTASAGLSSDITGLARPFGAENDMGAYEFQGASTLPPNATSVAASSENVSCGQTVSLSGYCAQGTLTWYDVASSGTSIGTGTNFIVSPIDNPTNYYATCETSSTCVSLERVAVPTITVSLPANPTAVSASENDICPNTEIDLSASCVSPSLPEWYNASMSVIGSGNTIQVSPSSTTTYTVICKNEACLSEAEEITLVVLGRATDVNSSPGNICEGQTITYTANCAVGTVEWYQSSSGGSPIATGSPYTFTPSHNNSNYYGLYVACSNGTCSSFRSYADSYYFFASPNVTVSDTAFCGSASEFTLTASCGSGAGGSTVRWFDAETNGNLLGTGSPFNHTPSSTITYYAECKSNNYNCSTIRVATKEVVIGQPVSDPTSVSTNASAVCEGSNVVLSANCSTGHITWYDQSIGGTALGTGNGFSIAINTPKTFYASCEDASCISNRVATVQVDILPSTSGIPANLTLTTDITGTDTQRALEYIDASNTIADPAAVTYQSGKAINLQEGFETETGTVFTAKADLVVCP